MQVVELYNKEFVIYSPTAHIPQLSDRNLGIWKSDCSQFIPMIPPVSLRVNPGHSGGKVNRLPRHSHLSQS
jgi:hypothetical protein